MKLKMLKNDIRHNLVSISVLVAFVTIASMLISSAINLLMVTAGATDRLFTAAKTPHFIQMHAGDINQVELDNFSQKNLLVESYQCLEMLNIDTTNVNFDGHDRQNTVMDMGFVTQSDKFDFLFGLNGQVLHPNQGEIAIPIIFMTQYGLKPGETVTVQNGSFNMKFTITDFVRDSVMNPSIVYSKRFVVNPLDFAILETNLGEKEYLIEYLLKDKQNIQQFIKKYDSTNMPHQGVVIDYNLLKTLNMLSDGLIAVVIFLISVLFTLIALLCLNFVMTTAIQQDYREIGVMKGLGISSRNIKELYITKYSMATGLACLLGYGISFALSPIFTKDITLHTGSAGQSVFFPLLGAVFIFLIVLLYANVVLGKFMKISAVAAINAQSMGIGKKKKRLQLSNHEWLNVNVFTAINDIFINMKSYLPLFLVFVLCCFIVVVPLNLYNTIKSPNFINYMGCGKSDLRIDLRQSENIVARFQEMMTVLQSDKEIRKYAVNATSSVKVQNSDGTYDNLNIETGDFKTFPINYTEGHAPEQLNEICLSALNAKEMNMKIDDKVTILLDKKETQLTVVGIYQDITNGGKTAKAILDENNKQILWYVVSIDFIPGTDIEKKTSEYNQVFYPARVTNIDDYISQTTGQTLKQLESVVYVGIASSILIIILLTALFIRMLITKDQQENAIMRRLGFSVCHIQEQYLCRSLIILVVALIVGTILSNTLGQGFAGALFSFLGASKIQFVINPVIAYVICPAVALLTVFITTILNVQQIRSGVKQ